MTLELCRVESCVPGRVTLYMPCMHYRSEGIDQMECDPLAYFHFLVQSYYYSWGWEAN